MKKLSVLALVAALLTAACGTIEYSNVNVIDPTNTLYVTVETPPGAADSGDPLWSTSCSNPAVSIDEITDVAGFLTEVMAVAYEEDFGVVHLCAGTYETDDIIGFPNLGSITIEGDGVNETIISGTGTGPESHALLAMVPADCLPVNEPCPSYFNVLTLKDLTLTNGIGGDEVFELDLDGDDLNDGLYDNDGIPVLAGGAVTAPLIATERVRFSNNAAPCGGAVALYGWTQLANSSDVEFIEGEDALSVAEYFSSLISSGSSQFTDTEFIENFAAIGGAIGGAPIGISEEIDDDAIISCLNAGPLSIVNSTFERNQVIIDTELPIAIGGGAIATANLIVLQIVLTGGDEEEEALAIFDRDVWLNITNSTFTDNDSVTAGGAVLSYGKTAISRTTFTNNDVSAADGTGGAIAVAGELSLSDSKFVGNSASSGGAVLLFDAFGGSHVLTRNTFTGNVATDQGGAISGWGDAGSARGNRFTSNRAPVGSAVAVLTETCSRTWSRRAARDWRGNTFRSNRGGRLPVECYLAPPAG